MSKIENLYEQLVERFVKWAENNCADIRAAIIVGSRARVDHPADEWADLDFMIITTDPKRYTSTSDWIENIGNPTLTFVELTPGGFMERRVLFEGMLDVDFAILPEEEFRRIAQQFQKGEIPPQMVAQILDLFGRGIRVLLDKDGMIAQSQTLISSVETPTPRPPTQHEFLEVINDFLYHAVWTAKKLRRGELWTAKFCLDSYMKWRCLLRMMEWHARATHDWNYDTWFNGRFLEKWAGPHVLEGLRNAFAHYSEEDIRRALLATMDMFRWLAMETAEKLNYSYPIDADRYVTKWIKSKTQ